ncbi:DUF6376 family protein [Cytobacillus sp. S13-E01]|uniref:DUF6376 family protein n=1 Tax=Cytobacillus sp. S13-E01 TaxID=3031326 RepID=UPI0023D7F1DF|nr:DUF6376 family protein [Cytobacillus sp. S13-E01]MDF0728916.1 DUF6376 family protein [Cytobacillus sp. S13-E01]
MRKILFVFVILSTVLMSACSLLEEVNNSLDYVNIATNHINTLSNFGEEAPQMIKEAATNPEAKEELENKLKKIKQDLEEFNKIEAPALAEDIHQKVVDKNKEIEEVINSTMVNGKLALEKLENTQIFTLITEITTFLNSLEELGN